MISTDASKYATKLVLRDTKATTVDEVQKEHTKLLAEKPHQFSVFPKVTTREQAAQRANYFSEVDGGYPRGMSVCYTVGISGDCGFSCPDFIDGICENGKDMVETFLEKDSLYSLEEDEIEAFKLYN